MPQMLTYLRGRISLMSKPHQFMPKWTIYVFVALFAVTPLHFFAQTISPTSKTQVPPTAGQTSGLSSEGGSTGGAFAPVYDQEHRPITAGGLVDQGPIVFQDIAKQAGLSGWRHVMGSQEIKLILEADGSGVGLIDYDNDGWLDLMEINGHVYPAADKSDWGTSFAERPLLFHNLGGKRFEYVPPVRGTGLAVVTSGRGAAFGDLFNDGKIDLAINPIYGPPTLLRNVNNDPHHWVELKLVGSKKGPLDAVGASVFLNRAGMRQRADVLSGGSYISSNDQRVHFGLGYTASIDSVEIRWPGGAKETVKLPGVDRIYTITEGKGVTAELCALCSPAEAR